MNFITIPRALNRVVKKFPHHTFTSRIVSSDRLNLSFRFYQTNMAKITPPDFKLERYFADYEFTTKYMMSCSDPEPMRMSDLVAMADEECRDLWNNLSLSYTESTGHPLLRAEIAKVHGVKPDETLEVVPQEGIYMAMRVMVDLVMK